MTVSTDDRYLLKFIFVSTTAFFIGSIHGVLQLVPPIRAWLDSIGSPYGGPGHMIDPLAHAHINLIGGVTVLAMAITYFLLPRVSGKPVFSMRLANLSFWWTIIGVASFYSVLMIFGVWEGILLLENSPKLEEVHAVYGPLVSVAATVMGIGLWMWLANVLLSIREAWRRP